MLLDIQDRRKLKLLHSLFTYEPHEEISLKELAQAIHMDKRSIISRVEELFEDIVNSKSGHAEYSISGGQLTVYFSSDFDECKVLAFYSQRSVLFILSLQLLKGEFTTIERFSEEHYINPLTLYRKLPILKKELAKMNISINWKTSEKLIGEERQIRLFYYYLLIDIFNYLDFDCESLMMNNSVFLSTEKLWLFITYHRLKGNHFVKIKDEIDKISTFPVSYEQFTLKYAASLHTFFEEFSLTKSILTIELRVMYNFFGYYFLITSDYHTLSATALSRNADDYLSLIEKNCVSWIDLFSEFFGLNLNNQQFSYLFFLILAKQTTEYYINKEDMHWFFRDINIALLHRPVSMLKQKITAFLDFLTTRQWFEKDYDQTSKVWYGELLLSVLPQLIPPLKVSILSKHKPGHNFYIRNLIESISTVPIKITNNFFEDIQLVISDYHTDLDFSVKVIRIGVRPHILELNKIKKLLEELYYQQL
ncbi:helix-turn-helix domain-containing protein [Enterococcus sp. LJL51]|uniref:helix-turn-helix domain-containing protein n=1 Tax=Enterococcus sp. LJL51 TaxID=3416656 RepID=UPI003CF5D745